MGGSDSVSDFLKAAGWGDAARVPLAGDASTRRFVRLVQPAGGASAVLMLTPGDALDSAAAFLKVTPILRGKGLSAPKVLGAAQDGSLILLEDLGDALLSRLDGPVADRALACAIDMLVRLGEGPLPDLPAYGPAKAAEQARLVCDWYPVAGGAGLADELAGLIEETIAGIGPDRVTMLRDCHAGNLVWLPDRAGPARIGVLDHQDAHLAHPAYDLVSLLQDARRDVPADAAAAMLARHARATGRPEADLRLAYVRFGAQRALRIMGIFARLARSGGRTGYLDHLPRVWGHLQANLAEGGQDRLRDWVRRHLPPPDAALRADLGRVA
jgi:aminoglycoside/choline kinase family phosphotransferase